MSAQEQEKITVAIDAQISATASGGTETALLSLISALGSNDISDRFILLGLKGHHRELEPFMPNGMGKIVWPGSYRWFDPSKDNSGRAASPIKENSSGGLARAIASYINRYRAVGLPMGARARRVSRFMGPFRRFAPYAYSLYRGLRDKTSRPLTRELADSILAENDVRVVHFPYPLHFETKLPFVYEPWGLPHHHQPDYFRPGEAEWMDALFEDGCSKAAMVVTATRWVKADIIEKYGVHPDKIAVIPRQPRFDHANNFMDKQQALVGVPEKFALFPSAAWTTKNHIRLIRAISMLRNEHGISLNLVCTGRTDTPDFEKIRELIRDQELEDQVVFLGVVPVERLNTLYKCAQFLVHPSIFEGLGLPLLEAFHNGLPVVASNAACIPEVVGEGALLFDPFDERDIVRALLEVMEKPEKLADLRTKGAHQLIEGFPSHAKMAMMFDTVYRHACNAPLDRHQKSLLAEMLS